MGKGGEKGHYLQNCSSARNEILELNVENNLNPTHPS